MPTNVTPEYAAAERRYQQAKSIQEKIAALEEMLRTVPKHKGTENLRQELKSRLAKLKRELERRKKQQKAAASTETIKKESPALIVAIGFPNSGKSTVINQLTGAKLQVAEYPFTTSTPAVATLNIKGAKLQLVELPGFILNAQESNTQLFAISRIADLALLITDPFSPLEELIKAFDTANIKLNQEKPDIKIKKNMLGGIDIIGFENIINAKKEQVIAAAREFYTNAVIEIKSKCTIELFKSALDPSTKFLPAIIILTRTDLATQEQIDAFRERFQHFEIIPSTEKEKIITAIWKKLKLIKIYTKEPGKKPKLDEPICLKKGSTVKDAAEQIHKDFIKKFRFARIWGRAAKFPGAKVGLSHKLQDEDIIEFHVR